MFDLYRFLITIKGPSWPWSYGSWIYNYLCNQCRPPPILWVRISIKARCTTLRDIVCHWLAKRRWFSPDLPVSSTNKTDRHDITEILLKVALITTQQTNKQYYIMITSCSVILYSRCPVNMISLKRKVLPIVFKHDNYLLCLQKGHSTFILECKIKRYRFVMSVSYKGYLTITFVFCLCFVIFFYLCLFSYSGVQHVLRCVFVLFVFVLCTLCFQFLWIVNFWLPPCGIF